MSPQPEPCEHGRTGWCDACYEADDSDGYSSGYIAAGKGGPPTSIGYEGGYRAGLADWEMERPIVAAEVRLAALEAVATVAAAWLTSDEDADADYASQLADAIEALAGLPEGEQE